jgi:hypothetical protein
MTYEYPHPSIGVRVFLIGIVPVAFVMQNEFFSLLATYSTGSRYMFSKKIG